MSMNVYEVWRCWFLIHVTEDRCIFSKKISNMVACYRTSYCRIFSLCCKYAEDQKCFTSSKCWRVTSTFCHGAYSANGRIFKGLCQEEATTIVQMLLQGL